MNFVYVTAGPFPIGPATVIRMFAVLRGLAHLSHNVNVLCFKPTESSSNARNKKILGSINNINFKYTASTLIWPKNMLHQAYLLLKGIVFALFELYKMNRREKVDILLMSNMKSAYIVFFYFFSIFFNVKIIQERNEYPFIQKSKNIFGKVDQYINLKFICRLFDGMFLITEPLLNYFKTIVGNNTKLTVIPMMVEMDRFINCKKKIDENSKYIAYCGYLWENKDGVPDLIKAFKIVTLKYPDLKLYLIGDLSNNNEYEQMKGFISNLNLSDRIVFTGNVHKNDIPSYLCNATILALARPDSVQTTYGFPTKLGEYLATGNPVVVTNVGEIPKFLKDRVNVFFAKPSNPADFAEILEFVLSNPEFAEKVSKAGQEYALNNFDYKLQAEKLLKFVETL